MPEFIARHNPPKSFDAFARGYFECMQFTDVNCDDDECSECKAFASKAITTILKDCTAFQATYPHLIDAANRNGMDDEAIGQNFWYSRNGHGTGFFDSDELPDGLRDRLQEVSEKFGEAYVYAGDDNLIYVQSTHHATKGA